jgi:hypothetical protein
MVSRFGKVERFHDGKPLVYFLLMDRIPPDAPRIRAPRRSPHLFVFALAFAASFFSAPLRAQVVPEPHTNGTATAGDTSVPLPDTVSFGTVAEGLVHEQALSLRNPGPLPLYVKFTPACGCISVHPSELIIGSGETAEYTVRFNSAGYAGEVTESVFIKSSDPALHNRILTVEAFVMPGQTSSTGESDETSALQAEERSEIVPSSPGCGEIAHLAMMDRLRAQAAGSVLYTELFYSVGCKECEEFLSKDLPKILSAAKKPVVVKTYNILEADGFETYLTRSEAAGVEAGRFPALIAGNAVYEGIDLIRSYIVEAAGLSAGTALPPDSAAAGDRTAGSREDASSDNLLVRQGVGGAGSLILSAVPVLTAGLLDGINPCAFTTIIFLVSALAATGRSRGRILLTGIVFAASVFVTYYLVGLGAFTLIRTASSFTFIAAGLRWVLFASLLAFAALSVHDAIRLRAGDTASVLLQLPSGMKRRIHSTVHGSLKTASLAAGAAAMGALVSIFELACTGQVYLPTITYMVARGERTAYGLLALYNAGFILPLAAVFALVYAGTGSKRLAELFRRRMAGVKFALAGLFLVLGVLTLLL